MNPSPRRSPREKKSPAAVTVRDVCRAMEIIAPTALAQSWDNVGLIAGDSNAAVRRILLCIDLTGDVVIEAVKAKTDFVLAYHPPIFRPIQSLRGDGSGTDAAVFRCIQAGIAVYATHTALDAADGGTNDVLISLCGAAPCRPLEYVDSPGEAMLKLVVFVPEAELEKLAEALFAAGAGHIGEYGHCAFRIPGRGSFRGSAATNPTIGRRQQLEFVDEVRLETVVPSGKLPAVVAALRRAHSYEEPAFDVYPLRAEPAAGIGRVGALSNPQSLRALAEKLAGQTPATAVQLVGSPREKVQRVIAVAGAAGSLPFRLPPGPGDVIVTGEIRHHDALTIRRYGATAIALGHWASERPVLPELARRLTDALPGIRTTVSRADCDPFTM